ncbi:uncharacterized protein K489DRAFT_246893 [Dissoconium aciculare CBS 342.82]|uniref:Uncharacterized protein n=1 Tax=Dissoconium aciculare CBS 342.82 TaxID=1314786 RepID=A0A6J3M0C4_9PEZI|nr:uncharacterized protein K489DRAFT_246893 [Dissoconium aciculare CBS 342.82]KAF1821368.1 hypothetical protein K489DRAFT_246893 [Dissoconium aciculare CBS 342.82]
MIIPPQQANNTTPCPGRSIAWPRAARREMGLCFFPVSINLGEDFMHLGEEVAPFSGGLTVNSVLFAGRRGTTSRVSSFCVSRALSVGLSIRRLVRSTMAKTPCRTSQPAALLLCLLRTLVAICACDRARPEDGRCLTHGRRKGRARYPSLRWSRGRVRYRS